ncbi:MAG: hypothetical protein ABL996_12270 [Micropepsaceae bacterium]
MVKLCAIIFTVTAALATASLAIASSEASSTADTARACRQEALVGHLRVGRLLPSMGPQVSEHRARMISLCNSLAQAKGGAAADLLSQCLSEAAKGPRVLHNGRDLDRDHVARQKSLCRKLAAK